MHKICIRGACFFHDFFGKGWHVFSSPYLNMMKALLDEPESSVVVMEASFAYSEGLLQPSICSSQCVGRSKPTQLFGRNG